MAAAAPVRAVGPLVLLLCMAAGVTIVSAQSQGALLYRVGLWLTNNNAATLSGLGWSDGGDACSGWQGVTCNAQGFITNL